ncbi:xylulokinase [Pontibacter ummariensis]|uniref:Xylulokinase n=1 Tax=Pontibacter ummariensis TaxID=1610492 RepID=A0A239DN14_9BACT|nr:FGGY family carbohydrate kinase [Pontibacter ummariensis]PRY13867.1 xylulokinase [Pontibacter ummariensis]SNS33228.1 xylulokinase [Pontibacter ummariensis]
MLLLGIDVGTSSIKVSVVDAQSQKTLASAQYPDTETAINSPQPGWAEQSPEMWWEHTQQAIRKANASGSYNPKDISAIGIAYQMHGLVVVDKEQQVLRDSIIWCDSRAVEIGNQAFDAIGHEKSLSHLLNSPGNFTASKLAWVKENEPETYSSIHKIMLPGDFVAMKLTGAITTSPSALSEGVLWDFKKDELSEDVIQHFKFEKALIPEVKPVFSEHGKVKQDVSETLGLKAGIPVTYKSGDQPNNALSLNVLRPGEVAATAGTSGVIYGVSDQLVYDQESRVNSFAHVNYASQEKRVGVLLCINGTGIMNSWVKNNLSGGQDYVAMNEAAEKVTIGSKGLRILPFGNGAERMLNNKMIGAHFHNIDLNLHTQAHIYRAVQEGISFAFRYGLDIMRENGMNPQVIRAGQANLFLSPLFAQAFVDATGVPVELYQNDGSVGAALGAGIGSTVFTTPEEAFSNFNPVKLVEPKYTAEYEPVYQDWKALLMNQLNKK